MKRNKKDLQFKKLKKLFFKREQLYKEKYQHNIYYKYNMVYGIGLSTIGNNYNDKETIIKIIDLLEKTSEIKFEKSSFPSYFKPIQLYMKPISQKIYNSLKPNMRYYLQKKYSFNLFGPSTFLGWTFNEKFLYLLNIKEKIVKSAIIYYKPTSSEFTKLNNYIDNNNLYPKMCKMFSKKANFRKNDDYYTYKKDKLNKIYIKDFLQEIEDYKLGDTDACILP